MTGNQKGEPPATPEIHRGRRPADAFVRFKRPIKLHRVLGTPGLFSAAYGNVGSSIYYALGVVALSALGLTPIVLIASAVFFLFTALTYSEGATALPQAGGSAAFAHRAFNDLISFATGWVLMLDFIVTVSISAFTAIHYAGYFVPVLKNTPLDTFAAIGLVVGLVLINIRGLGASSRLNVGFVMLDLATQVTIVVLGALLLIKIPQLIGNVRWGVAPTISQLLYGISISMIAYTGIETVANLSAETRRPARQIPRTVILVFFTVLVLYAALSMTALSAYPVYQAEDGQWVTGLSAYLADPIMGIVLAMPTAIQPVLGFWVALLAVTILVIATNAGILGASRLAYFMGTQQQLPRALGKISPRSRTPFNAIVVFSAVACVLIAIGRIEFLADLYAFGAMLAYTSAHISIIALRLKEPDLPRPFKIPLNIRIRKREVPVPAVVGCLATGATWAIVVYTHEVGRIVGFIWIGIGLVLYVAYRRFRKLPIIGGAVKK